MTTPSTTGPRRTLWGKFAVDPAAEPLARWLAARSSVTPNRVTALAFGCSLAAAACFATGQLRIGGLLFLLRYFFDCVDGMVARNQHSGSSTGAAYDLTADVVGIHIVAAALAWHLAVEEGLSLAIAIGLLATIGVYNWSLSHRKALAAAAGLGDGGSDHHWRSTVPGLRQWFAYAERTRTTAFPWVLEVEITVLGLGPLLAPGLMLWIVPVGIAAYVAFISVNLARTKRITAHLDTLDAQGRHRRHD